MHGSSRRSSAVDGEGSGAGQRSKGSPAASSSLLSTPNDKNALFHVGCDDATDSLVPVQPTIASFFVDVSIRVFLYASSPPFLHTTIDGHLSYLNIHLGMGNPEKSDS